MKTSHTFRTWLILTHELNNRLLFPEVNTDAEMSLSSSQILWSTHAVVRLTDSGKLCFEGRPLLSSTSQRALHKCGAVTEGRRVFSIRGSNVGVCEDHFTWTRLLWLACTQELDRGFHIEEGQWRHQGPSKSVMLCVCMCVREKMHWHMFYLCAGLHL